MFILTMETGEIPIMLLHTPHMAQDYESMRSYAGEVVVVTMGIDQRTIIPERQTPGTWILTVTTLPITIGTTNTMLDTETTVIILAGTQNTSGIAQHHLL